MVFLQILHISPWSHIHGQHDYNVLYKLGVLYTVNEDPTDNFAREQTKVILDLLIELDLVYNQLILFSYLELGRCI